MPKPLPIIKVTKEQIETDKVAIYKSSIAIVDDDEDQLILLSAFLKLGGYQNLCTFSSSLEFESFFNNAGRKPDIVIVDYLMPGKNGLALCHELKVKDPDIQVIMVTASHESEVLVEAFMAGAHDFILKPVNQIALLMRVRAAGAIKARLDDLRESKRKLEVDQQALTVANEYLHINLQLDGLTGLVNRRHFDKVLASSIAEAHSLSKRLSLVMIDVDYFKLYNDHYGHVKGDECLQSVAALLKKCTRGDDVAARYGGEEFAMILRNTSQDAAIEICERIQKELLNAHIEHAASKISEFVTLSIGVATFCGRAEEQELKPVDLIRQADKALYQSKENGRNRYTVSQVV